MRKHIGVGCFTVHAWAMHTSAWHTALYLRPLLLCAGTHTHIVIVLYCIAPMAVPAQYICECACLAQTRHPFIRHPSYQICFSQQCQCMSAVSRPRNSTRNCHQHQRGLPQAPAYNLGSCGCAFICARELHPGSRSVRCCCCSSYLTVCALGPLSQSRVWGDTLGQSAPWCSNAPQLCGCMWATCMCIHAYGHGVDLMGRGLKA